MKSNRMMLSPLVIIAFLVSCAVSPSLTPDEVRVVDTAGGKMVELPEGLEIHSVLETPLSSARSRVGEVFCVRTTEPVTLEGRALIPAGTRINGTVTGVTPPKANLVKAKIDLAFTSISLGGMEYPFRTKADLDKSAMIEKGAELGGEEAAKGAIGMAVPPLEAVFLADDALKGVKYYKEQKDITLTRGTKINVKINGAVYVPLR